MNKGLLSNQIGIDLVEDLKTKLEKKTFIIEKKHFFIFVCGGSNENQSNLRSLFLEYARTNLSQFHFLLAEKALQVVNRLQSINFQNIAEFENVIAKLADCVVIFPESPGSFAEVGYFSKISEISKKTLLVTLHQHQNDSFINSGPMDLIDSESEFRQKIILPKKKPQNSFKYIKNKLDRLSQHKGVKRRKDYNSKFSNYDMYEQAIIVLKMVELHPRISIEDFKALFFKCFSGGVIIKKLENIVGILNQAGLIEIEESDGHVFLKTASGVDAGARLVDLEDNKHKLNFVSLQPKLYEVR